MTTIDQLRRLLKAVNDLPAPSASRGWTGAGVEIKSEADAAPASGWFPDRIQVVTAHALQLSWLFESLRDAFYAEGRLDGSSKHDFFGRLATAANHALLLDDRTARGVCAATLRQAFAIYREMEEGRFEASCVGPINDASAILH